jgi:ABC-type glycerol-3-phosphate transport system substrate-binding protein
MLMLVFAFGTVACQENTSQANTQNVELVVWETYNMVEHELFLEQVGKFQKWYQEKHGVWVDLKAHRVPFDDLETNVRMAALGRKTPDIARVDALKVLEFAYHKVLVAIDELPCFAASSIAEKRKEYIPGAFDTNVIDIQGKSHLYGLPEQITCLALYWNRRMFDNAGEELRKRGLDPTRAPRTWDELVAYGQVLTHIDAQNPAQNRYGFAMNNTLWWSLPYFGCYGVSYVANDQDGNKVCLLGDTRSTAAFQLKVDLYRKYKIEGGAWQTGAVAHDVGFQNEKYAMMLMGPWNVQRFRNAKVDFRVALIPRISKEEAIRVGLIAKNAGDEEYQQKVIPATNIGGNNMVIFKTCRHPEIAYALIHFMASKEAQLTWCRKLNQIPVNVEAARVLSEDPHTDRDVAVFMQQALYATAPPLLPRYGYVELDLVNTEMELALQGSKTVEQSLKDAARKINEQILSLLNQKPQGGK